MRLIIKSHFTGLYKSAHGELSAGPRNDAQRVWGECDVCAVLGGGVGGRREPGREKKRGWHSRRSPCQEAGTVYKLSHLILLVLSG